MKKGTAVKGKGRGAKAQPRKPIREFYHRGAYSRHELREKARNKGVLPYRGKGYKVERRSRRRKK
jgi:hypothetical protein